MIEKQLKSKKDCMGCHGCANICPVNCISMESDEEGFLYPRVDDSSCIKCNKCINVCPIINKSEANNSPIAYSCVNNDERTRMESSSGGIFTLVAENVIDLGGVVFGAGFSNEFQVQHYYVETKEQIAEFRGSKYVQSRVGNAYKEAREFLRTGRVVLFTGTPCQIAGLEMFLEKPYKNLLKLDIICHGVPSPVLWQKYIQFRESESGNATQGITFRKKDEGWKQFSMSFLFNNSIEYRKNLRKDLYLRAFLKDVCLRPSCYDCNFKGLNRQSDITLADFWGIQNVLPEMDDDKGTSLVFVNSKKGNDLFDKLKDRMRFQKVNINQAVVYNAAAIKSANYNPNREGFMADLENLSFDKLVKEYCSEPLSIRLKRKIILSLRNFLVKVRLLEVIKSIIKR